MIRLVNMIQSFKISMPQADFKGCRLFFEGVAGCWRQAVGSD
jgi:hypothetical protein